MLLPAREADTFRGQSEGPPSGLRPQDSWAVPRSKSTWIVLNSTLQAKVELSAECLR